jgi:EmrB/QacA subfamily drug resistance transporter
VVLPITSIGIVLSALDGSIVNVSLRTIASSLGTDEAGISWVVIAYLLTITSLMGLAGGLGDVYGRKKIFQIGMLIFSLGSLFCSLSTNLTMLVTSRIIQAVGASGLMSNGLAIVITFINPKIRGRAIGINSLVVAASLSIGPVLGGILTQYAGWQSIFMINIPIGVIGFIATQMKIPETPRRDVRPDYLGITLFGLAILSLVSGMMLSFNDYLTIGIPVLVLSMICGVLFFKQEARSPNPMLSIEVMKSRQIAMGILSAVFLYLTINGIFFLFPFFLQDVLLFSQSKTGLYMIISPIAMSLVGPPAGFLAEKIPARKLATTGAVLLTLTTLSLSLILIIVGASTSIVLIMILAGLMSGSLSLFTNSNGTSVMNGTPPKMLSSVSGALNLSRNVGFTLGTSLTSVIFFGIFLPSLNPGSQNSGTVFAEAYYHGLGYTFLIISAIALLGTILSSLRGEEKVLIE